MAKVNEEETVELIEELDIDTLKAYFADIMADVVHTYGDDQPDQPGGVVEATQ